MGRIIEILDEFEGVRNRKNVYFIFLIEFRKLVVFRGVMVVKCV